MGKRQTVAVKRIWVNIRSRADKNTSIPSKHAQVLKNLLLIPSPWGLKEQETVPEAPDPGRRLVAMVSLKKYLGKGITQPWICYQWRYNFEDSMSADDWFSFSFNPSTLNYAMFVREIVPLYIEAIGAYYVEVGDDALVDRNWESREQYGFTSRSSIGMVWPVSFFDAELCSRAFGLTPEQVAARVRTIAEDVRCIRGGVYIIGNSELAPLEETERLIGRLKNAILGLG